MTVVICTYDIGTGDLVELACLADRCGFDTLWLGEHVLLPTRYQSNHQAQPGSTAVHHGRPIVDAATELLDPLVGLAAAASATTSLRLATGISILPLRHLLLVARAVATLHDVSAGRFIYGVGTGWLAEEYDAVGLQFDERGPRMDESLEIVRRALEGRSFLLPW